MIISRSPAARVLLLARTVSHLKPVQIYARVAKKVSRVRPEPGPVPPLRQRPGRWVVPVSREPSLADGWRVQFLNSAGEIARTEQWNDPAKPKLWLYNLHYFDDLCAAGGETRRSLQRALVTRWIAENPPPAGNGWEPYPVSLRIVNWIKWQLAGECLDSIMLNSLASQTRWLSRHVEWHLLGNHIFANAKALIFGGLFFGDASGDAWLRQGIAILKRELLEQFLGDGAHFELSPMYHATILEDVLDLINVSRCYGCSGEPVFRDLQALALCMRRWLSAMTHPDGGPAFFNDAAFGIAPSRDELEDYSDRLSLVDVGALGQGLHHLSKSGYVRANLGEMAAILDVAAIGPDYIPGHAHADTLSFEFSLGSERIVVNRGTSTYAPGAEREAQRATRAHSTVEIDGENSSEVWAAFRVARRARLINVAVKSEPHCEVTASHDGYRRLRGRNVHSRTWRMGERSLTIVDEVSGPHRNAMARFHLALGAALHTESDGRSGRITTTKDRMIAWHTSAPAAASASSWHPEFGISIATQCLEVPLVSGRAETIFEW